MYRNLSVLLLEKRPSAVRIQLNGRISRDSRILREMKGLLHAATILICGQPQLLSPSFVYTDVLTNFTLPVENFTTDNGSGFAAVFHDPWCTTFL